MFFPKGTEVIYTDKSGNARPAIIASDVFANWVLIALEAEADGRRPVFAVEVSALKKE